MPYCKFCMINEQCVYTTTCEQLLTLVLGSGIVLYLFLSMHHPHDIGLVIRGVIEKFQD
jgi:hypothetical protein